MKNNIFEDLKRLQEILRLFPFSNENNISANFVEIGKSWRKQLQEFIPPDILSMNTNSLLAYRSNLSATPLTE